MEGIFTRQPIPFFIMRAVERVNTLDYEACKQKDPAGIHIIEAITGAPLTELRWADVSDKVLAQGNDGLTLRLQLLYSTYMLAKIGRVLAVEELSKHDATIIGYRYYQEQKEKRAKLLQDWIVDHPEQIYLLAE